MSIAWEPHFKKLLALEAQKYSQAEMSEIMSTILDETVTRDAVRHALDRAHAEVTTLVDMPPAAQIPYVTKYKDYINGDIAPESKNTEAARRVLAKSRSKLLIHSDLHIPFHDEVAIAESIQMHMDADAYLGVADILDCYEHSFFEKSMDMPFVFEMDEALRFLEYLSNTFEVVLLLEANHEARVKRVIQKMLPPSLQFLAEEHILKRLCAPFPNIIVYSDMWYFQFGSGIFSHPEKASRVELKAAVDTYTHLIEWEGHYGLKPWNTLFVAHTHGMSVGYTSRAKIIETGMLSKPMAYAYSAKLPYKHPARRGYSVAYMDYGQIDWNSTREYTLPDSGM